jgi:gamma-glutamylcyclotransferase (GGCT)/AIG2-like uncharacterized protein YtfP
MKPIFVYGILKGRADAQPARVQGYRLIDMGSFPAAIPAKGGAIVGELIFVDDATIEEFDRIEGHPDFYVRTDVIVETGDGDSVELHQAQFYVVDQSYHDAPSLDTGALVIKKREDETLYEYHC